MDTRKEQLIKNAETCMKLERYDEAIEQYRVLQKEFVDDYRGWYGEFCAQLCYCIAENVAFGLSMFEGINKLVVSALMLCPETEKAVLKSHSEQLWKNYLSLSSPRTVFLREINDPYDEGDTNRRLCQLEKNENLKKHIYVTQHRQWVDEDRQEQRIEK